MLIVAGGKDLSNDTQIRVISSMEPEIHVCTKMLGNLSEKRGANFCATTLARLNDAFSGIFELEASPLEGQSQPQRDKKRRETWIGEKQILKA